MNLNELQRKLISAARSTPVDDKVPYTFEKRVMARLSGQKPLDIWGHWGQALSRAAMVCVAFMLLLGAGSYFVPAASQDTLSQDVEQTLFAAIDNNNNPDQETW